jgi:hypothetical protein
MIRLAPFNTFQPTAAAAGWAGVALIFLGFAGTV